MAKSSTSFKKGNKASKGKGRPKMPADVKAARKLSHIEFNRIANRYLYSTEEQIDEALNSPETPMIERMVLAVIKKGIVDGDQMRLTMLLDRTIGKVKEADKTHIVRFESMSEGQILELGREAIKYLESADDDT